MVQGVAVEARSLTKYYPAPRRSVFGAGDLLASLRGLKEQVLALDRLDLQVTPGQIFGLLGPNGAGKTTLCKIMNAVVLPTSGDVNVFGMESITHHREVTKRMVTVFGGELAMFSVFHPRLSCERNLRYISDLWHLDPATARERIELALHIVGLGEKKEEWYQKLSGGQKQRLLLAIPFLLQLPLTVLDEPTIRIDVKTRKEIYASTRKLLVEELQGTVLLTTHNINEVQRVCDEVAIIDRGRIVAQGHPKEVINSLGNLDRMRAEISPKRWGHAEGEILAEAQKTGLVVSATLCPGGSRLVALLDPAQVAARGLGSVITLLSRLGKVVSFDTTQIDLEEAFLRITEERRE